jgi:uncharacterized protein YjiS (DUF1127 family)
MQKIETASVIALPRGASVPASMPARPALGLGTALVRLVDTLLDWQERARERRHLSGLDDHLLRDIGLSRADVDHEVAKPFWTR